MSTDPLAKKRKIADGSAVPAVEQFQTTDDENSQNDDGLKKQSIFFQTTKLL